MTEHAADWMESDGGKKGLKVLLVEDDPFDADMIQQALIVNPRVSWVEHAWDGTEALDVLDRGDMQPDLAIIDLRMPMIDGFGLLAELQQRHSGRGFAKVVLSSSIDRNDKARSQRNGADIYLSKPDTVGALNVLLSSMIQAI